MFVTVNALTKCRCAILGVPGSLAHEFADALMGNGAVAAWIQEAGDVDSDPLYVEPDPGVGDGQLWLKEIWHECKIVALFDAAASQVRQITPCSWCSI